MRAEDARAAIEQGAAALPAALSATGSSHRPRDRDRARHHASETVVVFPLLHGPMGEDGTVQGLLEQAGVPYVGAGVLGSAVAMDKAMAKDVLAAAGIPQARWLAYRSSDLDELPLDEIERELGLPCFVKPANLGSSVGVSKAHDRDELVAALELAFSYDEWVVVEEAIVGREIELAVLGNTDLRVSVPGEVRPGSRVLRLRGQVPRRAGRADHPRRPAARGGRAVPGPGPAGLPGAAGRGHGAGRLPLRGGRPRAPAQRDQHHPGLHPDLDVPQAVGGLRACPTTSSSTSWSPWPSSATSVGPRPGAPPAPPATSRTRADATTTRGHHAVPRPAGGGGRPAGSRSSADRGLRRRQGGRPGGP